MRKFKSAVTDSDTSENCVRYDPAEKPGVANLMQHLLLPPPARPSTRSRRNSLGRGYGAFKTAVGEAVVEQLRPIREETKRILADKAYLESVYRMGAEKAAATANKTLRKVYKKLGFIAR